MRMSQFNFGEYDARREYLRGEQYFLKSFIDPVSFPLHTLSNRNNYIIVGQKGAGKTACQLYLENNKSINEGYLSGFISFFDDLTPDDYTDFAKTQRINILKLDKLDKIHTQYDFREVWKRIFFLRVASLLHKCGFKNLFVDYCLSTIEGNNTIIDGIKKSMKIEVKLPLTLLEAKISFDPSAIDSNEISLSQFNNIAQQLLISECKQYRLYFFVDELVISNMNTKSDEYRARICLIRDIVRSCCYMNDLCVREELDMHFICNLRPEIRTRLNLLDPEISKVMDGNDVFLKWDQDELLEIMIQKIVNGTSGSVDADSFLPQKISFGTTNQDFIVFLLNNTWYKPRDIVRFLKVYSKVNPSHEAITEAGVKGCLNEYARISAIEIFEQISVSYPNHVIDGIKSAIVKQRYENAADLADTLKNRIRDVDTFKLVDDLFLVGVIGNFDIVNGKKRYFWSHRQEEQLDTEMAIIVHPGLLNFFNVRHR